MGEAPSSKENSSGAGSGTAAAPASRLPCSNSLAGTPTTQPLFSVNLKGPEGQVIEAADPRSTRALVSLMDMNAVIGGAASHYGGPAAFAEIMSALHSYVFWRAQKSQSQWFNHFHLVNDAGHCENGLYALRANYAWGGLTIDDLKKFRSIESSLTGHGESHLFPEGVFLSNGPLGSAFPQSMGLALADAHAGKKRVTITTISDGACMEGEAREALAAVPGMAARGLLNPFVLIISDNNTKLSGRIDQESFSMEPTFKSLSALGWKVIEVPQGNDLQKCFDAIAMAVTTAEANPKQAVVIHARTIKGIGTAKTAASASGGHGFPLKSASELPAFLSEIYAGEKYPAAFNQWIEEVIGIEKSKAKPAPKKVSVLNGPNDKIQVGVASALIRARKEGLPLVSITSDLPGSTGLAAFRKEFPGDSIDIGVAESNMVSVAAGFSKLGAIPIVDTFAQFGVTKGALPHVMAQLSQAPMIAVYSHTGFQDAADGASHQALSYLAMTMSIPHVKVFTLSCRDEADALVYQAVQEFAKARHAGQVPESYFFFLGRENFPFSYASDVKYRLHEAQILVRHEKADVTLIACGSMVPQAIEAAALAAESGITAQVCHASAMSHPDVKNIKALLQSSGGRGVVIEDHQEIGGFGQRLSAELIQTGEHFVLHTLGVKGEFGRSAYLADELYDLHGISAAAIKRHLLTFRDSKR